jgi:hypothetical protein
MRKLFILAAAALLVAFALPAGAADFSLYGRMHFDTYYTTTSGPTGTRDTSNLTWDNSNWSNLGANIKVSDKIAGMIEMRSQPGGYNADLHSNAWWGTYAMGPGKLRIGRWWTPLFNPPPFWMVSTVGNAIATAMESYVSYEFGAGPASITVAGLMPYQATLNDETGAAYAANCESSLPKLELKVGLKFGGVSLTLMAGQNSVDCYTANTTGAVSKSVDASVTGLMVQWSGGPITVRGSYMATTSPDFYGGGPPEPFPTYYDTTTGSIVDAEKTATQVYVTYKISDSMTLNAGYGMEERTQGTGEDPKNAIMFSLPINITKAFMIRPEVSLLDNDTITANTAGATAADQGEETKYGVRWVINF